MRFMLLAVFFLVACQPGLDHQPKIPIGSNPIAPPPHTTEFKPDAKSAMPPLTEERLHRGQTLYNTHCTPCHGWTGEGDGMAVQRGFPRPVSFHSDGVRKRTVEDVAAVIANGNGAMIGFRNRLSEEERRSIAHYVKVLQLSFHADSQAWSEFQKDPR